MFRANRIKPILFIAGLVMVVLTSALQVLAQGSDRDLEQRVFNLGILRTGKSSSKSARKQGDPKAILAQIQKDFTAIQVTNNDLADLCVLCVLRGEFLLRIQLTTEDTEVAQRKSLKTPGPFAELLRRTGNLSDNNASLKLILLDGGSVV